MELLKKGLRRDQILRVFVLIFENQLDAFFWVLQDPLGISHCPETEYIFGKPLSDGDEGWEKRLETEYQLSRSDFKFTFTRILPDKHGLGHAIKVLCKTLDASLLVAPKSAPVSRYLTQCQTCPAIFAQRRIDVTRDTYSRLLLLATDNKESRETLHWVCRHLTLPLPTSLYVIHSYWDGEKKTSPTPIEAKNALREKHREVLRTFGRAFAASGSKLDGKSALVRLGGRGDSLARSTLTVFYKDYPAKDKAGKVDKSKPKPKPKHKLEKVKGVGEGIGEIKSKGEGEIDRPFSPPPLQSSPDLLIVAPKRRFGHKVRFGGQFTQHILEQDADVMIFKTNVTNKVGSSAPSSPRPRAARAAAEPTSPSSSLREWSFKSNGRWWQLLKTQKSFAHARSKHSEREDEEL
jgi:hypothetical protein